MTISRRLVVWIFTGFALAAPGRADEDTVQRAMRDELARTTAELKLEKNAPPYFAAYRIEDNALAEVVASFGGLVTPSQGLAHKRTASVELRVGSMQLDQTNYLVKDAETPDGPPFTTDLPLDDNYTELRRHFWLLTDRAYRRSVDELAKKTADLQNKTRPDDTGDYTSEPPTQTENFDPPLAYDAAATEQTVRELSAVFRDFPAIDNSYAMIRYREITVHYVNSEGTTYARRACGISIVVVASTQASDGRRISDVVRHLFRSAAAIPVRSQLLAEARALGQRLTAAREASLTDTYNGPVLFEGEAAAVVFAQGLTWRLTALKRPVLGSSEVTAEENPLQNKIGGRVLPAFLNVTDDPTRSELAGRPLLATSRIDDEGVPTSAVKLVVGGRLKTLLTDRVPSPGLPRSTGSRHGGGPTPTNMIVTSDDGLAPDTLKARFLKLVQERGRDYGVIVRRMLPEIAAVKVFTDGREELLRNVELDELSLDAFKDIIAAGREPFVDHLVLKVSRPPAAPSDEIVSLAVPALLFDDLTLKKADGDIPTRPVVGHPYFDK